MEARGRIRRLLYVSYPGLGDGAVPEQQDELRRVPRARNDSRCLGEEGQEREIVRIRALHIEGKPPTNGDGLQPIAVLQGVNRCFNRQPLSIVQ